MASTTYRCARLLLLALIAAQLAACGKSREDIDLADYDFRARYPIGVQTEIVAATFRGAGGELTTDERGMLHRFVAAYVERGQEPITILAGGSGAQRELAETIRAAALDQGLAGGEILVGVDPSLPADEVALSFVSHTAVVPECGYWWKDNTFDYNNTNSANFGCANQHNLALMLDNPYDLVEPRAMTPRDGLRTIVILNAFQAGEDPSWETPIGEESIAE